MRWSRYALALSSVIFAVACRAPSPPGASCLFNRDCTGAQVCANGFCRAQCADDRDCINGWTCAIAADATKNVCVDPRSTAGCDNVRCTDGSVCAQALCVRTCAPGQARCRANEQCSPLGLCAAIENTLDASAGEDVVDASMVTDASVVMDAASDVASDGGVCAEPVHRSTSCASDGGAALSLCAGRCANTTTDSVHCGACGTSCGQDLCASGVCLGYRVRSLAVGQYTRLVAREGSTTSVLGWGEGTFAALAGIGTADRPAAIAGTAGAVDVAIGYRNGCVIIGPERTVSCWGSGFGPLMGSGTGAPASTPTPVMNLRGVSSLAMGLDFACAVHSDGMRVSCWGNRSQGRFGALVDPDAGMDYAVEPVDVPLPARFLPIVKITAGDTHTCALSAAAVTPNVVCWGLDTTPHVGRNVDGSFAQPDVVAGDLGGSRAVDLFTNWRTTCAATARGQVFCWGDNDYGQASTNMAGAIIDPERVIELPSTVSFTRLGGGDDISCAMDDCGSDVWCWGRGSALFSPLGTSTTRVAPRRITSEAGPIYPGIRTIGSSNNGACALYNNGNVLCWGTQFRGETSLSSPISSPAFR